MRMKKNRSASFSQTPLTYVYTPYPSSGPSDQTWPKSKHAHHTRTNSSEPLLARYDSDSDSSYGYDGLDTPQSYEHTSDNYFQSKLLAAFQTLQTTYTNNIGLFYVFLACTPFSIATLLVKSLESDRIMMPVWEVILLRMILTSPLCMITAWATNVKNPVLGPKPVRWLLCARGIFGFCSALTFYTSVKYLPASEALVIGFLVPICSGFLAAIILHEPLPIENIVVAFISLLGVLLIAKPPFLFAEDTAKDGPATSRLFGVLTGLLAVLMNGTGNLAIRRIGHQASSIHCLQYFALASVLGSPITMFIFPTSRPFVNPFKPAISIRVIGLIFAAFAGQVLQGMGIQNENPGRCLLLIYLQLPIVLLIEVVFLKQEEDPLSLLGSFIIIGSAFYIVLHSNASSEKNVSEANNSALSGHLNPITR